jgi:hypothetical protein
MMMTGKMKREAAAARRAELEKNLHTLKIQLNANDMKLLVREVGLGLGRVVALPSPRGRSTPDLRTYSVALFLNRECDRT